MTSSIVEIAALAIALAGILAVLAEIAIRDRSAFAGILSDLRAFAEPRRRAVGARVKPAPFNAAVAANGNARRAAA